MNRTLIIKNPSTIIDFSPIIKKGYLLESPYNKVENKVLRFLRKIHYKSIIPFKYIWYNRDVLNYRVNTIIVFESLITNDYLEWLRDNFPQARIIVWYWNIVSNTISPRKIKDDSIEKWSFSRKDCYNYGMKFNPAPYFSDIDNTVNALDIDFTFVGKDKGRLKSLLAIKETLINKGYNVNFTITPTHRLSLNKNYSKKITYKETLRLNSRSKAILDIIEIPDSGQSLRVFEALFSNKKLVTNSILIKDYDFYNENNIFVIEDHSMKGIEEFMEKEYVILDKSIKNNYSFESWFNRFFIEDENFTKMQNRYNSLKNM